MPVRPYEIVYIIDPDVNEENSGALVERFRALAEAQGAEDIRVDTQLLGRRRLAYNINHKREGQYVVMHFQSEAAAPAEVERVLKISDGVLRAMVIRLEEMPPLPVAPPPAAPAVEESAAPAAEESAAPAPEASAAPAPEASAEEAAQPAAPAPEVQPEPAPAADAPEQPAA